MTSPTGSPRRRAPGRTGFVLVDVLLAAAFLAIAIVPLLRVFVTGLEGIRRAADRARAEALLDPLQAETEAAALTGTGPAALPRTGETAWEGRTYAWRRAVRPGPDAGPDRLLLEANEVRRTHTWRREVIAPEPR